MTKHEQISLLDPNELVDEQAELSHLITSYNEDKTQMDALKTVVDAANLEIKTKMRKMGLTEWFTDSLKTTVSVTQKSEFIEDVLLNKVKELGIADKVIKTREYVDMVALEDAIYQGLIHASQLADCQTAPKEVVTLRVTKIKAAK